jgi:hypothetical protein
VWKRALLLWDVIDALRLWDAIDAHALSGDTVHAHQGSEDTLTHSEEIVG